jgi:hypothetical protein
MDDTSIATAVRQAKVEAVMENRQVTRTAISKVGNVCKVFALPATSFNRVRRPDIRISVYDVSGAKPRRMPKAEWSAQ